MKTLLCGGVVLASLIATHATIVATSWSPLFKGIEHIAATNTADAVIQRLSVANCLRIDLLDPDVQLFPSPPNTNSYVPNVNETYALSVSNFLKRHDMSVATVANFYDTSQGTNPSNEGIPATVYGLLVTTGMVVSAADYGPGSGTDNRWVSLLFTTNKEASLVLNNAPPGTNTTGIYTAVSGYYPVLTNGVVPEDAVIRAAYPDATIHSQQPRTIFGLSQDRRYLYMMTVDGRQTHSAGATSVESGIWIQYFGAWDAVNMDGGGSAAMYYKDCVGNPAPLGKSSYPLTVNPARERISGCQFGVWAPPLNGMISGVTATGGLTTATINWITASNATTQVAYGLTTNTTSLSIFDGTLATNHSVTLNGLSAGSRYYYRVMSIYGGTEYSSACGLTSLVTTNAGAGTGYPLTNRWSYQTANLDGVNWRAVDYDDSTWPNGTGCLWADSRVNIPGSTNATPNFANGTRMPVNGTPGQAGVYPFSTYYFRTRLVWTQGLEGVSFTFSNFVDDGAVFYLNGVEIQRINMTAGTIVNSNYTPAGALCFGGNATCGLMFSLTNAPGSVLTNLQSGTNVIAVEAHNFRSLSSGTPSPDVTFESALFYIAPPAPEPPAFFTNIVALPGETSAVFTWTTLSNSTSRIEYGTTPGLGSTTSLDTNLVLNHAMVLNSLLPLTTYYFRILSTRGTTTNTYDGTFTTSPYLVSVIGATKTWRYDTNNLDGTNWTAVSYDDSGWLGQGPGLLYNENNNGVSPRNTLLPLAGNGFSAPTYFFRTHFTITGSLEGFALLLTNFVDDGAVFHLNGVEVRRLRMAPAPQVIAYTYLATGCPADSCDATREVPDVFRLSGDVLTNLVIGGDNVLAVRVHQNTLTSPDIVFGSEMSIVRAVASETELTVGQDGNVICIAWPGANLTLQQSSTPGTSNGWSDVPGPARTSPYCVTNTPSSQFFRLRN